MALTVVHAESHLPLLTHAHTFNTLMELGKETLLRVSVHDICLSASVSLPLQRECDQ